MSLKAVISADASKFFNEMKKVEGTKDKLKSGFKTLGVGVAAAGAAIAAAGAAIAGVTAKLVLIGEEANTSENRIRNIAEQMGLFGAQSGKVADRILGVANAQAKATGIDRMAIRMTQAKLLTFKELAATANEVGGNFDRATQAAIDMAAAGFGSAEGNAVQLGKALQDPIKGITALARSGVTFTQQEREKIQALSESGRMLEAQNMILSAVEKQVGNTANATANSTDKIKQQIGILIEQIAKPLSNAFDTIMPKIEAVFNDIAPKMEKVGENLGSIFQMAISGDTEKLSKIAIAIGEVIGQSIKAGVKNGLKGVAKRFYDFFLDMAENQPVLEGVDPKTGKGIWGNRDFSKARNFIHGKIDSEANAEAELLAKKFAEAMAEIDRQTQTQRQSDLISQLRAAGINSPLTVSGTNNDKLETMIQELRRITQALTPVAN